MRAKGDCPTDSSLLILLKRNDIKKLINFQTNFCFSKSHMKTFNQNQLFYSGFEISCKFSSACRSFSWNNQYLPPANEVTGRQCFHRRLSSCPRGWVGPSPRPYPRTKPPDPTSWDCTPPGLYPQTLPPGTVPPRP